MSTPSKMKLLVVDDEAAICDIIAEVAEDMNFDVDSITDPLEFASRYSTKHEVIVSDLTMPGMDGIELIRFLANNNCTASIILVSGFDQNILALAGNIARERGLNVLGSLTKPIDLDLLESYLVSAQAHVVEPIKTPVRSGQSSGPEIEIDEIRNALAQGHIVPFFQPQVSALERKFTGVEALARWIDPAMGIIPPFAFIPLCEEHGLIDELTDVMFLETVRQNAEWRAAGLELDMSINFSVSTIAHLDLPDRLAGLVTSHDLSPSNFTIEITESSVIAELGNSLDVLSRLRMKGFSLSIDDFGTGYSSMQQLRNIPFTEIKIDQSFVMPVCSDDGARVIVETTAELGRKLGMTIVAEGVEDQPVWDQLNEVGVDTIQGYFVAKPMPAEEIESWAKSWNQN